MRITKRIILIILSGLLIFSAAACGKAEENPKGEDNTPPVEQEPPAQEEPPSEDEGSDTNKSDDYMLSNEMAEQLKKDYCAQYSVDKIPIYDYYGTYSEYAVLYFPTVIFDMPHGLYLDETNKRYLIRARYYFEMYAYKDGSFFPILDICNQGLFTEDDMDAIVKCHNDVYENDDYI